MRVTHEYALWGGWLLWFASLLLYDLWHTSRACLFVAVVAGALLHHYWVHHTVLYSLEKELKNYRELLHEDGMPTERI